MKASYVKVAEPEYAVSFSLNFSVSPFTVRQHLHGNRAGSNKSVRDGAPVELLVNGKQSISSIHTR